MTNYNDGKWHGWNGGESPLHPQSRIDCVYMDGRAYENDLAGDRRLVRWTHGHNFPGIVAFRVVKEYRDPIEVYLWRADGVDWIPVRRGTPGAALFREVLPD